MHRHKPLGLVCLEPLARLGIRPDVDRRGSDYLIVGYIRNPEPRKFTEPHASEQREQRKPESSLPPASFWLVVRGEAGVPKITRSSGNSNGAPPRIVSLSPRRILEKGSAHEPLQEQCRSCAPTPPPSARRQVTCSPCSR